MSTAIIKSPPPMCGIKQALAEVKAVDANTALTERGLRRMVLTGEIPSVRIGKKYLLNMDLLYDYLSRGTEEPNLHIHTSAIRKIAE